MKIIKLFAFVALVAVMAACSGNSAADVASKISNGEQLTQKDFTTMIDYCGQYAKHAQSIQDKINNLIPTSEESVKLTDEMASLSKKFPYAEQFFTKIASASQEELGAENVKKVNELTSLTWFSSPDWADVASPASEDGVVGEIVDMPSSDSSNVIAVGAGEAVVDSLSQK